MYIEHSIVIKGDIDKVFQLMTDVERWHEILPHVYKKKVMILKKEKDKLLIENNGILRWRVSLVIDRDNKLIKAEHIKVTKGLIAIWKFEETSEGTKMVAIHKFRDRTFLIGIAKELIMSKILPKMSKKTLEAIKKRIEMGE